jgi:hypothetical protein
LLEVCRYSTLNDWSFTRWDSRTDWLTWICILVLSIYLPPLSKNSHFRKTPSVNNEHLCIASHCWGNQSQNIPTKNCTPA